MLHSCITSLSVSKEIFEFSKKYASYENKDTYLISPLGALDELFLIKNPGETGEELVRICKNYLNICEYIEFVYDKNAPAGHFPIWKNFLNVGENIFLVSGDYYGDAQIISKNDEVVRVKPLMEISNNMYLPDIFGLQISDIVSIHDTINGFKVVMRNAYIADPSRYIHDIQDRLAAAIYLMHQDDEESILSASDILWQKIIPGLSYTGLDYHNKNLAARVAAGL